MAVNMSNSDKSAAVKKAAKKAPAVRAVKTSAVFKIELTKGPGSTYTEPNGTIWRGGQAYTVSAQKRLAMLSLQNDYGVPYFRDYVKPVAKRRKPEDAEGGEDVSGTESATSDDESGLIDTAEDTGAVSLPKGMRRSEGGVTV